MSLRPATYVIVAHLSAIQVNTASVMSWVLQATYGPIFNGLALSNPGQVAVDSDGNVYIADTGNDRLVKLNSSGAFVSSITGLTNITGVAVDSSGNIYVAFHFGGGLDDAMSKYTSALTHEWTTPNSGAFRHLATDGTHVYVTAPTTNRVHKLLCSTGAFVSTFGSSGSGNGQFNDPWGICLSATGASFYVADRGNHRIQRIGSGGTFLETWGALGSNDGQFNAPRGIARDSAGNVWVADYGNDRLQRFSVTGGTYQETIAQSDPSGIGIATGDILWVSNASAGTIAKWDEQVTSGGYGQIAIEIDGNLSPYIGIGPIDGAIANVHTAVVEGPDPIVVRAFGKATEGAMTLSSVVLSVHATPRS